MLVHSSCLPTLWQFPLYLQIHELGHSRNVNSLIQYLDFEARLIPLVQKLTGSSRLWMSLLFQASLVALNSTQLSQTSNRNMRQRQPANAQTFHPELAQTRIQVCELYQERERKPPERLDTWAEESQVHAE